MARIVWTRQSREDIEAIRAFIARDAPKTADAFLAQLIAAVDRLEQFPFLGGVVPELTGGDVRERIHGNYRIIYRASEELVEILMVYHGARLLDKDALQGSDP